MPNPTRKGSTWQWRKTRALILKRDGYICWMCGQPGADTVDHLVPYADGGPDNWANLAAAHGAKRPEYGCPGNYSRGAKKPRKPRVTRQNRAVLGKGGTPECLSLSANPSPDHNILGSYQRSAPTSRVKECRSDGIE